MSPLVEVRHLVKHFGAVKAVDGISFSIEPGTCFGLLGPNGAGKTTTVEMLEGLTPPTGGEILYKGTLLGERFRSEAGIMFQATALQEYVTVRETLEMFGRFYPRNLSTDELVRRCALEGFLDRDTRRISGGQRQRLLFAIALVNDPEVIFLDEPTTGLDPQARRNFWALIRDSRAQGKTIVLTTHYMEEAYELCDKITIMDNGRIIAEGTPQALLAEHFHDVILQLPRREVEAAAGLDGALLECGDHVEIHTSDVNGAIERLLAAGVSLNRLRIRERTLDDLFLELTGKELRP